DAAFPSCDESARPRGRGRDDACVGARPYPRPPAGDRRCAQPFRETAMSSTDSPTATTSTSARPERPAPDRAAPSTSACNSGQADVVPPPHTASPMPEAGAADTTASTWITKEAGNRRTPYDRARLERAIDRIHAGF